MAVDIMNHLPKRALNILQSSSFHGADLVKLESDVSRPSFRVGVGDKNHVFFLNQHPPQKVQGLQTNAT